MLPWSVDRWSCLNLHREVPGSITSGVMWVSYDFITELRNFTSKVVVATTQTL